MNGRLFAFMIPAGTYAPSVLLHLEGTPVRRVISLKAHLGHLPAPSSLTPCVPSADNENYGGLPLWG